MPRARGLEEVLGGLANLPVLVELRGLQRLLDFGSSERREREHGASTHRGTIAAGLQQRGERAPIPDRMSPGRSSRAWPTRKDGLVRVSSTPSMPTPRSDL